MVRFSFFFSCPSLRCVLLLSGIMLIPVLHGWLGILMAKSLLILVLWLRLLSSLLLRTRLSWRQVNLVEPSCEDIQHHLVDIASNIYRDTSLSDGIYSIPSNL